MKNIKISASIFIITLTVSFTSCKKNNTMTQIPVSQKLNRSPLTNDQLELSLRLKQIAMVFGEVMKDETMRSEFNKAISVKLKKTTYDESISLKEIYGLEKDDVFHALNNTLATKLMNNMQQVLNSNKYQKSAEFASLNEKAKKNGERYMSIGGRPAELSVYDDNGPVDPVEPIFYLPYSENFTTEWGQGYTITSDPINNSEENIGIRWDANSNTWEEVLVNDQYAYEHPTYIILVEDSYNSITDLSDDLQLYKPKQVIMDDNYYEVNSTNTGYNSVVPPNPSSSQNSTLFVKDIRVTELGSIFDGKVEFAFVVPSANEISLQNGNPTITSAKVLTYAMKQVKRSKVRSMRENIDESVNVGWTIRNWASTDGELGFIIYELDRPFLGDDNSKKVLVDALMDAAGIFSGTGTFQKLANGPLRQIAPLFIPGASADLKNMYILDRNEVYNNQTQPNLAMTPSLLGGLRPYGSNAWMVNYIFQ